MMNSPFVRLQAEKLARRVQLKSSGVLSEAVDNAYQLALGRHPTPVEFEQMVGFIRQQPSFDTALADFCQVLLCSNEFVYVE